MDMIGAVLPVLAFLACPLMMVFCLFGMRRMGCASPMEAQADSHLPEERVAALRAQLLAIQAELDVLEPTAPPVLGVVPGNTRRPEAVPRTDHAAQRPS